MSEKYLSRVEASDYLSGRGIPYSPNTLGKLACTGGGPVHYKFSNRVLYLESDLEAWIRDKIKARANTLGGDAA
ncbi:helix-turn-helix transcriptional regulator [Rhodospirillum sp. A1_3_36]|uniref:helix-turn-helix transcriptional regulator n=1 Tax=Rhodospirillum sp. A1_3_36 TaxID=3391666 RepID=UPI0039A610B8